MSATTWESSPGWLRNPSFDLTLIVGAALLALAAGGVSILQPVLFPVILLADLWLLGYHHVIATFTRLAFDGKSVRQHRFLVLVLPVLVLAAVLGLAYLLGAWALTTTYFYWQWFHYTRQSYGIERVYRRKVGGAVAGSQRLTTAMLYAVPLWGILHRSHQAPERFLGLDVKFFPAPQWLVTAAGVAALALVAAWLWQVVPAALRGRRLSPHTLYLVSHTVVFLVGYVLIPQVNYGWLVINIWHNAQYILFVWMFNSNRYKSGVEGEHWLISSLSQREKWPFYFLTCLGISTVIYFGLQRTVGLLQDGSTLPLMLIAYQVINFHHYVVDALIWKVRQKPLQQTLELAPS